MQTRIRDHDLPVRTHNIYTVFLDDGTEIETLVTNRGNVVDNWISKMEQSNHCRLGRLIVGLDIEWRANFSGGPENPVAVLQLCVGKSCLVYQIFRSWRIPVSLGDFLGNSNYTFVGVGVKRDAEKLWRDYGLHVANTKELCPWAASELGRVELGQAGLKRLAMEIVGVEMEKPKNVTLSPWDKPKLSLRQVAYASLDAYMSFEIARRLSAWY